MKEFWREKALPWIEKGKARLSKLNGWMRLWFVASVIWVVATAVYWKNTARYHFEDFPEWTMVEYELYATDRAYNAALGGHLSIENPWRVYSKADKLKTSSEERDSSRARLERSVRAHRTIEGRPTYMAAEVDASLAAQRDVRGGGYLKTRRYRNRRIFSAWKSRLFDMPAWIFLPPIGFLLLVKLGLFTIAWIGAGFRGSGNPTDD